MNSKSISSLVKILINKKKNRHCYDACFTTSLMRCSFTALLLVSCLLFSDISAKAQSPRNVGIKTNLLYDATATANIGMEFPLAHKWSLDLSGNVNVWNFSEGKRWKHWLFQPELRLWTCANMGGHFFAVHLLGGQYNIGKVDLDFLRFLGNNFREFKDYRHQGWYGGAGIGYGYSWMLSRHWNIEFEIACGYIFSKYDLFECAGCGKELKKNLTNGYIGPTKLALDLIYVF